MNEMQGQVDQDCLSDIVRQLLHVEEEMREKSVIIKTLKDAEAGTTSKLYLQVGFRISFKQRDNQPC